MRWTRWTAVRNPSVRSCVTLCEPCWPSCLAEHLAVRWRCEFHLSVRFSVSPVPGTPVAFPSYDDVATGLALVNGRIVAVGRANNGRFDFITGQAKGAPAARRSSPPEP